MGGGGSSATSIGRCWGSNQGAHLGIGVLDEQAYATPQLVVSLLEGVHITSGQQHTCIRRPDSSVRCWGTNEYGELGDGTKMVSATPVSPLGL
jgi:alpha-tubulin suppressor-like RCC1 family protein